MKSELVGYIKKSDSGKALKINILKSALDKANITKGMDGTEYVSLIMNLDKIKRIIGDEHEVTSVCQLIDEDIQVKVCPECGEPWDSPNDAECPSCHSPIKPMYMSKVEYEGHMEKERKEHPEVYGTG